MSLCTSWLPVGHRAPIALASMGITMFINQISNNPGPGDRYGTAEEVAKIERQLVIDNPELSAKVEHLRVEFDKLDAKPTEKQVKYVLRKTDSCTDIKPQDVLANPDESRKVAWFLYEDAFAKGGQKQADKLFKKKNLTSAE